ncbi:NB-ARC domain-containing disease resistance protein [Zostera marina]|uniref:NB-ARC domain-containing disease resistance protein n=1 Tax=Zostera marina TaxID=29655 RepID=A0A0K9NV70_ZOSMR|nr:NB-ARC domain-containing disease resistance protein [Zostera marina]
MESVLISFILKEASKHLIKVLGEEFTLIKNTLGELEKLKRFKTIIVNVQRDVAGRELSQQDVTWLDDMIDAAYDIEDIVDLFNTKILRRRSNNNNRISTRYTRRVIDFFSCTNNTLIFRHKIGTRVQNTFVRLAHIADEKKYYLTLSGRDGVVGNLRTTMSKTFSDMVEDDVLGRDHDLKIILEQLLFKEKTNSEVLVLFGMGGVGKTTLAKYVYHDSRVHDHFGERKFWVCVSEIFDPLKIFQSVFKQIKGKKCKVDDDLEAMRKELKKLLKEDIFLLVLDDVWTNSSLTLDSWSNMKSLFRNCKILITTREENVASVILSESYIHNVGCLPEDACWSLFKNIAFPNGNFPEELKDISKSIVKKCKGVPLSLRVLGSMMRTNQDYSYWKGIEENNILDPNYIEGENRISEILKFSYYHLPLKSKFCFVYCSIFPKDSVMKKIDLIQQWAGNGFIPLNEGNEIFEDLLSRCFFQDVEKDVYGSITTFKMHDLIHDLAESIAKSLQCGILDDSIRDRNLSDRKQVLYLSIILNMGKEEEVSYSDISIKLKDARVLRTLQLLSYDIVSKTFLDNCFTKFKFLRVLVCSDQFYNLEDIPPSIDNLKLLRYVDFSNTSIRRLPETICNLQNLQTLKLNKCFYLHILPKEVEKIIRVKILNAFIVNDGGTNLNELRHLDHLEGSLCIKHLGRSRNVVLENGILNKKSKLVSLELRFGYDCEPTKESDDEKVLQALQPHSNLKSLNIIWFYGFSIPLDMISCLRSLTHLEISFYQNLTSLSNNMGTLRSLTHLLISDCENLKSLSNDMNSLQSLTHLLISDCPKLTILPNNMGSLKSLTHLKIYCCPNIISRLPDGMEKLVSLELRFGYDCGPTKESDDEKVLQVLQPHPNLKTLNIISFGGFSIPLDISSLQSLTHLEIYRCPSLTSLPNDISSLQSLTHLKISYCLNLTTLPNNMGSLQSLTHLEISYCKNLTCLPNSMGSLQSLTHLKIYSCPNISRLPDGMEKLECLIINNCPMLKEYCKRKKPQV